MGGGGGWHGATILKQDAEKTESHTCVLVSGAHKRLIFYDRTRVVCITKSCRESGDLNHVPLDQKPE